MPSEVKRGCGYRKVNSLYLVGSGIAVPCDILPLELMGCPTCGFEIPFTRNLMKLNKQWMVHQANVHYNEVNPYVTNPYKRFDCKCFKRCPLCYPDNNDQQFYGVMWVGTQYTPSSFILEAEKMGVSKKIPQVPKWLKLGETWVLLAHLKVPKYNGSHGENGLAKQEPEYMKAVFYAFMPQRIEMPIWKSQATKEYIEELKQQGITAVVVNDGDKVHAPRKKNNQNKLEL